MQASVESAASGGAMAEPWNAVQMYLCCIFGVALPNGAGLAKNPSGYLSVMHGPVRPAMTKEGELDATYLCRTESTDVVMNQEK